MGGKQQEYKEVIYRCCSKNDVKNIHWKFHSPNQTIPIFMRGKRINLQPLNTAVNQPAKNQLTTESDTTTKQDSQADQKIEQDQKPEEISVGRDNQNKMKDFSKKDVKNTYKKFHSPNQTIPSFIGWKRVNLQPLNTVVNQSAKNQLTTESVTIIKQEDISVGRDNQNKMKELSKQFPSPNQTIPNNVFQNLHRKPSSDPTIPKILQWRRVHLQSVKTMIKQYKTESVANHN